MRFFTVIAIFLALAMVMLPSTSYARDKQYTAKQVHNFVVDGNLDEWGTEDPTILLDELKDTGNALPDPNDFSGEVMVGWNSNDAGRIYLVYIITDDDIKDVNAPDDKWWEDDSAEIIFDFNNDGTRTKWAIGAGGDLSATATIDNTEYVIVSNEAENLYIYEIAITAIAGFDADDGVTIGLSPIYNDCENGAREHQLGWIAGGANDSANMGDIIFSEAVRTPTAVELSDKLVTVWGALKL